MSDEWIEWKGRKKCPVPPDTYVDVRLRNGREYRHDALMQRGRAWEWHWRWEKYDPRFDLVAYRRPTPSPVE